MTTRVNIPYEVDAFYDKTLLMRAVPRFLHMMFGQSRPLPSKSGTNTIRFRRYDNLAAKLTPLTEGVTPGVDSLGTAEITAVAEQYGSYVELTDLLQFTSPDPLITETLQIQGDQAGDTLDILTRDVLNLGTSVIYPSTHTARNQITAADLVSTALVDKAVRVLKNNEARTYTGLIGPNEGVGTEAVQPSYWAIIHPNVTYTIQNLPGFQKAKDYPNQMGVMPSEVGAYNGVRFVESTNAAVFAGAGAGGIDVYSILVFGMNAYGLTEISGQGLKSYIKQLGSAGTADPIDQRSTIGWKATHVTKILNDNFMTRMEVAVAA